MRYLAFTILLLTTSYLGWSQTKTVRIEGVVFYDKNENGIRDKSEKGLKNIPISDGEQVILTNKDGSYSFDASIGSSIFAIPPSKYKYASGKKNKNANFLYIDSLYTLSTNIIKQDISLIKQNTPSTFSLGAIGDIQMKDYQEINYANQSIIAELIQRNDIDFNIFLGDQINETLELLPDVKQMIEKLPMPSWSVLGNHDRNFGNQTQYQDYVFNHYFGASHYAFNYGEAHFIILNNVYSEDASREYKGYVDESQISFIRNDLKYVPANKTIVLCQHIPMVSTKNKEEVLALFGKQRKVLILSGHTHQVSRRIFSQNIQEVTAGATCGNWWVGERDWLGIPTALMQCGSPRGYFSIDFANSDYDIRFKGVGLDADRQMDIWLNGQDTIDKHIDKLSQIDKHLIVANIYGASDSTKVLVQVDSGEWFEMTQTKMIAPSVSRLVQLNRNNIYPTEYSRKGALRRTDSPHIWTASLPSNIDTGIHIIRIKAKDNYGFSVEGSRMIYYVYSELNYNNPSL